MVHGLSRSISDMWQAAGGATEVIATQLIKLVETQSAGKVNFVTIGAAAALNPVAVAGGEVGDVYRVNQSRPDFSKRASRYVSLTHGVEFDIGVSGGLTVAAWTAGSVGLPTVGTLGVSYPTRGSGDGLFAARHVERHRAPVRVEGVVELLERRRDFRLILLQPAHEMRPRAVRVENAVPVSEVP